MLTKMELLEKIEKSKANSAWKRGVKYYALIMTENFEKMPNNVQELKKLCLDGAESFKQASYGGCYLIYDFDICETLCCPSEQKKRRYGILNPNSRETWLDVQARALCQAYYLIRRILF